MVQDLSGPIALAGAQAAIRQADHVLNADGRLGDRPTDALVKYAEAQALALISIAATLDGFRIHGLPR